MLELAQPRPWEEICGGPLKEIGGWGLITVAPRIPWPVDLQSVQFRGETIWILPATTDRYPGVAVRIPEIDYAGKSVLLSRFLSALSWTESGGITSMWTGGGGSHLSIVVPRLDRNLMHVITERLTLPALPEPDDRGALALALMREGRSLMSKPYAFLTYFRVLETAINPRDRAAWINAAISRIAGLGVREGLRNIQQRGAVDIGKHLYESRRMAIAHASRPPIIDPDDLIQNKGFHAELPVMESLAELAIVEKLGIRDPR